MKSIKVKYFAMLRDKTNLVEEDLETELSTYRDLFQMLTNKYNFDLPESLVQVAVNNEFCRLDDQILDHSIVAYIPPVAGG